MTSIGQAAFANFRIMKDTYLDSIRRFEGYCASARPDGSQLSNGYGTRALFSGETIGREEAEARFRYAVGNAEQLVERCAPGLDEGTKAALTSLTYNTGVRWMQSGLGDAVRHHDFSKARDLFQRYTLAAGQQLPGLVARRAQEVTWFGNDVAPTSSTHALNASDSSWVVAATPPPDVPGDASTSALADFASPLVKSIEILWNLLQTSDPPKADQPPGGAAA
jgi:lysozyme